MEKYLIVGTGGVGGSIAGFLALAGKDVTCIARGKHLEAIREKGLHLRSDLKGISTYTSLHSRGIQREGQRNFCMREGLFPGFHQRSVGKSLG